MRDGDRLCQRVGIGADDVTGGSRASAECADGRACAAPLDDAAGDGQRRGEEIGEAVVADGRREVGVAAFDRPRESAVFDVPAAVIKREDWRLRARVPVLFSVTEAVRV